MRSAMTYKELPFKKKLEFLWGYYKVHILIGFFAVVFLASQIHSLCTRTEPLMNVVMVNLYQSVESANGTEFDAFLEEYGYEGVVDLRNQIYVSDNEDNKQADIQSLQYLMTVLATENPEIYFGPRYLLENYAKQGCFVDLSTVFSEAVLEQHQNRLVYSVADGQQVEVAYGIVIEDNQWLAENQYYYEDCCFGILATADNPAIAQEFAEYLLSFESQQEGGK